MKAISPHNAFPQTHSNTELSFRICVSQMPIIYTAASTAPLGAPPPQHTHTETQVLSLPLSLHFQSFKPTRSIYEETRSPPVLTS